MCTAVSWKAGCHYFGRNLDLERSYGEAVAVTPRNYPFRFRHLPPMEQHYAMIGMATTVDGYPLYYEATNEAGLSMAGLNFPGLAHYRPTEAEKDNVPSFELIPWVLGQCGSVTEVEELLKRLNITEDAFSKELKPTPLHWLLADARETLTLEAMEDGLHIHRNPVGVLTNNPPFEYHLYQLRSHMKLSASQASNQFAQQLTLEPYSNGMGALGLPGDYSSPSRFVKAAFVKLNSRCGHTEEECVNQFFHILGSVAMPRGCVEMPDGTYEITRYSCCCNTDKGIYYYTTYDNSRITAVDLQAEDLTGTQVITYPLLTAGDVYRQN